MAEPEQPAAAAPELTRQLAEAFYSDLRRVARGVRNRTGGGETMRTTALISEAYLKLHKVGWESREHFMNAAATAMRQALIDYARARLAVKRGGDVQVVSLQDNDDVLAVPEESLVELDEALRRLAEIDPRQARVVECRYFAGYSVEETARVLGMAERTVHRDWERARAWLYRELGGA